MNTTYDMTKALVDERQGTLRHEARQHRLAQRTRFGRRQRNAARKAA